ncbi:hypothetical protein PTSG_09502 [Salpingoeca rosetta]|uniref:Nudix hydrolase domain-containing protein n=1 Tax=Salpingoeca rosetta (strain ATCC 50818 / BSB-021) TaxID=946362 RepID=F2UL69_SALR5|nr:uncharacterized protein PTSG_09502 [Salpingoeca rosetta]EGD77868.1 hypothetical protein PTSG_09502 [Salpingoeca rosetta]|eukprot:XP_004989932.1 hypothetical protein PTSG_09502 [Salpingoeca rosetta]
MSEKKRGVHAPDAAAAAAVVVVVVGNGQHVPAGVRDAIQQHEQHVHMVEHTIRGAAKAGHNTADAIQEAVQRRGAVGLVFTEDALSMVAEQMERVRALLPSLFIVVWSRRATDSLVLRQMWFDAGVNQVTHDTGALSHVVHTLVRQCRSAGTYTCDMCGMPDLSAEGIFLHYPLYHCNHNTEDRVCPICNLTTNVQVHIRNHHIPASLPDVQPEPMDVEHSYCFSLIVCRHPATGRFLLVQDYAGSGFWLPGGRVDVGETFQEAAIRETQEEAGVDIKLTGILQVLSRPGRRRHRRQHNYRRTVVVFLAEPATPEHCPAKTVPDYESVGACWVSAEEVLSQRDDVKWRGKEPVVWIEFVTNGGRILPLDALAMEGSRPPPIQ